VSEEQEDWKVADWNVVANTIIRQQQEMIEAINRAAGASAERILIIKSIDEMTEATKRLTVDLDSARNRLDAAMSKLSTSIMSIVSVPIAVTLVLVASVFFYFKYIAEYTWLLLLAIACFRYLGDSITAIVRLFGLGKNNAKNGMTRSRYPKPPEQ
jgi:predicted PurR-regulated permease PerM